MSTSVPVVNILVNGYNGACGQQDGSGSGTCADAEQILDIANVIGMAPGLTQVLFYEGSSTPDILNTMATDQYQPKVISSSWYRLGFDATTVDPIFLQFQAQGQTFLEASGDGSSYNNDPGGYAPPLDDPNITLVGGTSLLTNGAGGTWQSETGWSDSGGGYVSGISIPTFQQLSGVINTSNQGSTSWRNSPDVAGEADFDNSTVDNGTFYTGYGGTSYAAPRWAGLMALANQQAAANGSGNIGFLAPAVYTIGTGSNYSANFHDITSGNNGFPAVVGYDLVTGWGSPIGQALIDTLSGPPPPPPTQYWKGNLNVNPYGSGCYDGFHLYIVQDNNTASTQWYFYLYTGSNVAPQFTWTLADSAGTLASGSWNETDGTYPFTTSRAPSSTPVFTINSGYFVPSSGCYLQITGSVNLQLTSN